MADQFKFFEAFPELSLVIRILGSFSNSILLIEIEFSYGNISCLTIGSVKLYLRKRSRRFYRPVTF